MADYRISEVAERTGFSASALRFYEDAGLIGPAQRSANGYRKYADRDLERLRFIAKSKRLGLSLEEITGLIELFDLDECAPVQERLRELLVAKRRELVEQIDELKSLSGELGRVADRLGLSAAVGACDDSCACLAEDSADGGVHTLTIPLRSAPKSQTAIACTVDPAALPERLTAWQRLAERVVERVDIPDGVQVRLAPGVTAAEVADLAAKEHECCSFYRFIVGIDVDGTTLAITAPPGAQEMIEALIPAS